MDGHSFFTFAKKSVRMASFKIRIAFSPLPEKSVRNGFIQDQNRKDCFGAVPIRVLILLLRVSGAMVFLLVTELLLKFSGVKFGGFYWFPVKLMSLRSSPYLLKIDVCCPSPLLHACLWLTLKWHGVALQYKYSA
jgi:hypothetical protein